MRAQPLLAPVAALAVALLSGCATGPDPTQVRLDNLDARVTKLERFVSNGSLVQLAEQEDSLQAEVRDLRGRLDSLERRDQRSGSQQQDLYAALDKRVKALEQASTAQQAALQAESAAGEQSGAGGAGAAAGAGGAAAAAGALPGVTPTQQSVYTQAFDALKAGSYSVAIHGFEGFLKTYPDSPLAPNAEYWLGEAHYVNQNFNAAEKCFRRVLKQWPDSGKASAAMFDLGNTLIAQGKVSAGRATLRKVIHDYPGTDVATQAAHALSHAGQ
ncbi:MAG: tol-pal system protein YbgF [Steroidobacteraceae bacterium]